jgi:uncharacterized protein DUF835
LEPAVLLLLLSGIGLVLILAWTMYRIQHHRMKMQALDDKSTEIGRMDNDKVKKTRSPDDTAPTLPENELLVVLFRNKKRPWRGVINSRSQSGDRVLVITSRPPREIRRLYPNVKQMIWLNRSTAHELENDTLVVNPTNLSSLLEEIRSYMGKSRKGGSLVFEGFEEVISTNEIDRVIRFMNMLKQYCNEGSISAVVPLPYRAVPQRVRNQMTENFESVVIG